MSTPSAATARSKALMRKPTDKSKPNKKLHWTYRAFGLKSDEEAIELAISYIIGFHPEMTDEEYKEKYPALTGARRMVKVMSEELWKKAQEQLRDRDADTPVDSIGAGNDTGGETRSR